ncbi:hypothetical protein BGX30_012678 [Mortierella sp. GBA39]|nr:hypothetical protein BGX30_012678 [Mortierella sp. GBA39]
MSSQDYRVSTIAILCRDCGNDVGLYPGKHKCPPRPAMPAMPAIPAQYQEQQQSSYSSRGMNGGGASGGRRPPDLNPGSLHSGGGGYGSSPSSSSRTPTSSSFQERMGGSAGNGSSARTPTAMSFQERLKERDREKQQRDREEREAAARSVREDLRGDSGSNVATPTSASTATTTGSLWNRLKAAKEVVTATITGEEKWPESDDSDHEGETHVGRVLREYADKREEAEMAKKIAELEMTPYSDSKSSSLSKATGAGVSSTSSSNSGSGSRSQYLRDRDAPRRDPSSGGGGADREDYYGRSLRARGLGADEATSPSISSTNSGVSNNSYGSSSSGGNPPASANRYRTTSDLSRDDALSRLEGKSEGDKLAAQVSHLGSTTPRGARAHSPNPSSRNRDYQDNSSGYNQQGYGGQLSPSSAGNGNQYSSSAPSQRSISPASNRRYDSPSPSGPPPQQGRYAAAPPQPSSPSYPNNNNSYGSSSGRGGGGDPYSSRGQPPPQQSRPGPGQGGRPDYDRRPTYPPNGSGGPPQQGSNLGAYGQRQQYQQYQQQQNHQQQRQQQYSSNNYF